MNAWTRHQKMYGNSSNAPPRLQYGYGSVKEDAAVEDKEFQLDTKTGLMLPADAAKERRKVPIGFGRTDA